MRGYGVLHRRTLFSLWRRWSGLLDSAQIRAAYPCRAGPDMLFLNDNDTKFKDDSNQRWAKEFSGLSFLIHNDAEQCSDAFSCLQFSTCRWRSSFSPNYLDPWSRKWGGHRGPVIALSHTTIVTVSPKGISPQNTAKISIRLSPEFENPELGKQFIFFLTSSFYKK